MKSFHRIQRHNWKIDVARISRIAVDALRRLHVIARLREVPQQIRQSVPTPVRLGLKLMNARFDDRFQLEMLRASSSVTRRAPTTAAIF